MLPSSWGPGLQNSMGLRAALLLDKGHGARCQSGLQGRVGEVSKAFGTKGADGRLDPFAKVIHGCGWRARGPPGSNHPASIAGVFTIDQELVTLGSAARPGSVRIAAWGSGPIFVTGFLVSTACQQLPLVK